MDAQDRTMPDSPAAGGTAAPQDSAAAEDTAAAQNATAAQNLAHACTQQASGKENTYDLTEHYIAHTYGRFPLTLVDGQGSLAHGADGREYIDLGTGIAVNGFGMADPEWAQAVYEQLRTLAHTSNLYYTDPPAQLARLLCERTGMARVFFANSGAEANEAAIKVARKYSAQAHGSERYTILTLRGSFHGRTLTTLAATGQEHYHEQFQPLTPGFTSVDVADGINAIRQAHESSPLAGVLIELIQGEGGVNVVDPAYVRELSAWCTQHDVPFMIDEVQTGNGRTGYLYAFQRDHLHPDVVTTAKGIGGGLPLSACMMNDRMKDVLQPGDHATTFGANPAICAGAINILNRITPELLDGVKERSEYIIRELQGAPGVVGISGLGLMLGVSTCKPASEILAQCQEHGVLVLTAHDKIRLLPALNIPMDLLAQAIDVLKTACAPE